MSTREGLKSDSNNPANYNQNVCALEVCRYLGVQDDVRYLHTIDDVRRAVTKLYGILPVLPIITGRTVGSIRREVKRIGAIFYLLWLPGHVILLDAMGKTIVDSDPRKIDRRQTWGIWGIYSRVITSTNEEVYHERTNDRHTSS